MPRNKSFMVAGSLPFSVISLVTALATLLIPGFLAYPPRPSAIWSRVLSKSALLRVAASNKG